METYSKTKKKTNCGYDRSCFYLPQQSRDENEDLVGENYNHFVIKVITNELGFILALFVRNHEGLMHRIRRIMRLIFFLLLLLLTSCKLLFVVVRL